jgi:ectoine hydroxylase-related dioxygenase (phytanoyl-CoA dioxygenase family)
MSNSTTAERGESITEIRKDITSIPPSYMEVCCLTPECLQQLVTGEIVALCVKDFYPQDLLAEFIDKVTAHPIKAGYNVDQQIIHTGSAFYDTVGNPIFREEYLNSSMEWMKDEFIRFKRRAPIHTAILEFMATWLYGVQFEHLNGKSMWAGSARFFDQVGCLAHRDNLGVDAPEFERARELISQFAVNVYAQVPDEGAEIDIWFKLTEEEYDARCVPGSYGINPNDLPVPTVTISPKAGDLILFDSNRLHAARPSNGVSIAQSCFLGYRGLYQPLSVWS